MTGVLDGVVVLDLTMGIAGPVTGMLLADHGAQVTKIEPPGGDPTRAHSGAEVWHRGKRSAVLDPHDPADCERVAALASHADVLVENFAPGIAAQLGIDHDTLLAEPPPRVLLDHRIRRRRRARRPARGRRARRGAHRPPVGEPRRPRRHARAPGRGRARVPRPRGARRLLGGRAPSRPAPLGRAVGEHGVGLPRHARDQRRAARARADRPRPARVDVAVPRRARHHAVGVAARRARRRAELPELDQRPARTQGRVPLRRRALDPPVGPAPRLRDQRSRGRPPAAHGEDHPSPRRDHAHRDGRQRDAPAAPLPTTDGGGDREVPGGTVGRARRRGRRPPAAAAVTGGGAARSRVPRRRVRHRGRRPRTRRGAPGRARLRPARVPHRRPHRTGCGRGPHRHRPRRSRRAGGCHAGSTHHHACPRVAARRCARRRPRTRGRRTLGHDDARRPRRRGHQGQPAARLLLDEHAHRDGVQPGQAQHRDEPQGSRGDGDPARARRHRRRRAAQHALRRRGAPRCRLREPAGDQARPRVLPHARLRARRAGGAARQRPDRCRVGRSRLARRRTRSRRHPALAGGVVG